MKKHEIVVLAALLVVLPGCRQGAKVGGGQAGAAPSSGGTSESERTRIMQEKAAEIDRRFAEIQEQVNSGQMTPDQAAEAVAQLDQERREVMAMGEK